MILAVVAVSSVVVGALVHTVRQGTTRGDWLPLLLLVTFVAVSLLLAWGQAQNDSG